jgi:hypothetical protein
MLSGAFGDGSTAIVLGEAIFVVIEADCIAGFADQDCRRDDANALKGF